MLDSARPYLSLRAAAVLPLVLFSPAVVAFFVDPDVRWGEYLGVFFHLSILFLVSRLDAATWAKAAGYSWVALDVLAGVLVINGIDYDTAWAVRLGAHVMAGTWLIASSLTNRSRTVAILGTVVGLWLGGYSFVGTVLPEEALRPAGILILMWFASIALFDRSEKADKPAVRAQPAAA
ncbi:hypothetical protein [Nocardiopsis sp. ATB16-24]|uniref:hypothetical protein n=1 Tax=Nocardiopsis sp. ATB16-24 TaxID=3019555 RepID=UPI0025539D45|nr:hypothetical protein [Nocardiopsis sp. ATB16-24]